jgi:hypothetical protein
VDTRDLRDPQKLGEYLLHNKKTFPGASLSSIYDTLKISLEATENYPQDESLATVTTREYRAELQQAAEEGDKYAATRLRELNGT